MAVAEPVLLLTPELDGEGRLEGDLLRPPDADPVREPLGVVEMVAESVCVPMLLGLLELDPLPLPLLPPLSVGEVVEESEGEGDTLGVAGVGKKDTEGGLEGDTDPDRVPLGVGLRDADRLEVIV